MDTQPSPLKANYRVLEALALGLAGTMFLLSLVSRLVHWDWLFDTAYLLAGAYLVFAKTRPAAPPAASTSATNGMLYVSIYLFLDSVLQAPVGFIYPSFLVVVYLMFSALYGAALVLRLRERDILAGRFGALFQGPALFTTLAVLVPLACMYMPMLRSYHPWKVWTGPMVMHLPGTVHMDAGRVVDMGYVVVLRGIDVVFSRAACVLLAAIGVAHWLRINAVVSAAGSLRFMRVAVVLVGLWWLLLGAGYRSLGNIFNLIFLAGYVFLLLLLFAPNRIPALADSREQKLR